MRRDKKRMPGFYWVRFEGDVLVAEYTNGFGCSDERPHWHLPGSGECWKDKEICELLSGRLQGANARLIAAAPELLEKRQDDTEGDAK
jgi:hypothetical protein